MNAIHLNSPQKLKVQNRLAESQATLTHDPFPSVMSDETQLVQVLQNLITNAIKFRSQAPLQIHIGSRLQSNFWLFSVQDNGIGRVKSAEINKAKARSHQSTALEVTRERLDILNKEGKGKSLEIIDLKNDDESAAGTKVVVKMPLEEF